MKNGYSPPKGRGSPLWAARCCEPKRLVSPRWLFFSTSLAATPVSVVANNPRKNFSGRASLEAANLGVSLNADEVVFRCNLITAAEGKIADYSAGHISTEEAASLIHAPGLNVVWANASGDIAWWAAARLPMRPQGVNPTFVLDGATERRDDGFRVALTAKDPRTDATLGTAEQAALYFRPIRRSRIVPIAASNHPLARRRRLTLASLVILPPQHGANVLGPDPACFQ